MNLKVITEIAEYFENQLNFEIPPRTPFVGRAFNATRAGIHADGLMKDEEIYNIFDTTDILGRPPIVVVDAHSGTAGIAAWVNSYYKLAGKDRIDKRHPGIAKIKNGLIPNTHVQDHGYRGRGAGAAGKAASKARTDVEESCRNRPRI